MRGAKKRRFVIAVFALLLLFSSLPARASVVTSTMRVAPAISIVAHNYPEDLEVRVELGSEWDNLVVDTERSVRVWEMCFRLFREDISKKSTFRGNDSDFAGAVLLCRSGGEEHRVPIPRECLTVGGKKDVMTLDCESWTLSAGLPDWRGPASVAERAAIVIAAKALVFLVMGYRKLRSWLSFLAVNLATQITMSMGVYNMLVVNSDTLRSKTFIGLMIARMVVLILAEIIPMVFLVNEHDKDHTATFIAISYILGCVIFLATLAFFPV